MQITIKSLGGRMFPLEVAPTDTVEAVKDQYQEREGVPVESQRLIYNSVQLEDDRTLVSYAIQEGAVVYLVLRSVCHHVPFPRKRAVPLTGDERARWRSELGEVASLEGLSFRLIEASDDGTGTVRFAPPSASVWAGRDIDVLFQAAADVPVSATAAKVLSRVFHPFVDYKTGRMVKRNSWGDNWSPELRLLQLCQEAHAMLFDVTQRMSADWCGSDYDDVWKDYYTHCCAIARRVVVEPAFPLPPPKQLGPLLGKGGPWTVIDWVPDAPIHAAWPRPTRRAIVACLSLMAHDRTGQSRFPTCQLQRLPLEIACCVFVFLGRR